MAERNLHLHATVTRDGDWYVARCLEVEVTSQGGTIESALANIREALELYFEDEPLPAATPSPIVAPVDIRIPARVRRSLVSPARRRCGRWNERVSPSSAHAAATASSGMRSGTGP